MGLGRGGEAAARGRLAGAGIGAGGARKAEVEGSEGATEATGGERKNDEGIGFGDPIIGEKDELVAIFGLPKVESGRPEVAERVIGLGDAGAANVGEARPRGEWSGLGETGRVKAEGIFDGEGGLR